MTVGRSDIGTNFTLTCILPGGRKTRTYQFSGLRHLPVSEADRLRSGMERQLAGRSQTTQQHVIYPINNYLEWCTTHGRNPSFYQSSATKVFDNLHSWLISWLSSEEREYLSSHRYWEAGRLHLRQLQQIKVIPVFPLPPLDKKVPGLRKIHRSTPTVLDKLAITSSSARKLALPSVKDGEFFDDVHRASSELLRAIREAAQQEASESIELFKRGQEMARACDIERLEYFLGRGVTCDPDLRHGKYQARISFFSTYHPNGLQNLVGYLHHRHNGIAVLEALPFSWGSVTQSYGREFVRRHLGLTRTTSVAFFILLVIELGVNVESLDSARLQNLNGELRLTSSFDDPALTRVAVVKPRAAKVVHKLAGPSEAISVSEIMSALYAMTEHWRQDGEMALWLAPRRGDVPAPIGKHQSLWKAFLRRWPSISALISKPITRADVRVLGGVVVWFEAGGDMQVAAAYLNNRPDVALRNYIPKEIQDAFYEHQIRKFQNLLVIAATQQDADILVKALRFESLDGLSTELEAIRQDKALSGSPMFKRRDREIVAESTPQQQSVFMLSPRNVAVLERLCDALKELQARHPRFSLDRVYKRFLARDWLDLRNCLHGVMRSCMDRELASIYREGLALARNTDCEIEFPCLNELLEAT
ncbi:hypothetical protein SAMN04487959_11463 [Modicisalibacter xianhensis]|uniref:Uncharacterized protein n=2 Tax=Oceanospirillales TaxID=135619 RepID=A0A1I3ENC0_9GAMM|nr:hypothetical protein SAMN04487959_11463 [Halomonas xianhensis]